MRGFTLRGVRYRPTTWRTPRGRLVRGFLDSSGNRVGLDRAFRLRTGLVRRRVPLAQRDALSLALRMTTPAEARRFRSVAPEDQRQRWREAFAEVERMPKRTRSRLRKLYDASKTRVSFATAA